MNVNHRIVRLVVAFAFGLFVAYGSYQWITDTERPARRAQEESVVLEAREILRGYIGATDLALSDPLKRVRAAGKVYIYPTDGGWELSGHYRRADEKAWHDFLMMLDANAGLLSLRVNDDDPRLVRLATSDPRFSISD
ncbi:MAG: hypothetical protein ACR2Q3_14100 [Woeseiaceae bacterium]